MPANILTDYGLEDLEKSLIPSRSRLYHLEPIGIGTPFVESLTSYITRLAHAHCVPPNTLIAQELRPRLRMLGQPGSKFREFRTINGVSSLTKFWIEVLEQLTLSSNLQCLTMLTWSDIIDYHGVVRSTRAWCPMCYEEWSQTGQIMYDPLLWSLQVITRCPRHQQSLYDRCPNRDCRSALPHFTKVSRLDYCPNCSCYLGLPVEKVGLESEAASEDEREWVLWREDAVCELIAAAPNFPSPLRKEAVAQGITSYMERTLCGSFVSLADQLELHPNRLIGWQRGLRRPRFNELLQACFYMGVRPLHFLAHQADEPTIALSQPGMALSLDAGRGSYIPADADMLRQKLEAILTSEESSPVSMRQIARCLGYPVPILQHHFPQLSKAISERYRKHFDINRQREVLEAALADETRLPALQRIARRLGCDARTLQHRFPEECRIIAERRRKRIDTDSLRQALESVLESQEIPFPALEEVARRLGCPPSTLRRHFPTLCRDVIKRRRESINQKKLPGPGAERYRRQLNIDGLRHELENILQSNETPPPTLKQIARRLECTAQTLRKYFPELCHEIVVRHRTLFDFDGLRRSLEAVLLNDERPPSVKELARNLGCPATTLRAHFPQLCAEITERHWRRNEADKQRKALETALAGDEGVPLSLEEVARRLGCPSSILIERFPELCKAITKRRRKFFDAEHMRQTLETVLLNDAKPPALRVIARQLGYSAQSLQRYCPDLCAAIINKRKQRLESENMRYLQQALEAVLASNEEPVSLLEVARRLDCSASFLQHHFRDQCRAISARFLAHIRSRRQVRIERMCDEVRQTVFLSHSSGKYPSIRLLRSLLSFPFDGRIPELERVWRETLRELGYDS